MALSQNEIARLTRVIGLNGQAAIPQTILPAVGFTVEKLKEGIALADAWDTARDDRDAQNDLRFTLSGTKEKALKEANLQVSSLRDFIDELWPDGSNKDNLLNRAFIVTGGSQKNSQKDADFMGDGKALIRRVRRLPQQQKDLLAEYGWNETRLTKAWNLVDAFEEADRLYAEAKGDKESKTETCNKAYQAMETWFRRAVRFIHRELIIQDPQNVLRIVQRLELPISHPSRRGGARVRQQEPTPTPEPEVTPEPEQPEEPAAETSPEPEETIEQPETVNETQGEQTQEDTAIDPNEAGVDDIDDDFEVIMDDEEDDEGGEAFNDGRG